LKEEIAKMMESVKDPELKKTLALQQEQLVVRFLECENLETG
jgi:hypothetical protein